MRLLFLLFGLIFLNGCDGNPIEKMKKEKESKKLVIASLKDGESAKFQNVNGECGEVNAKNGFGAYTGFKRYIAPSGIGALFEESEPSLEFETIWYTHCTNASSQVNLKQCEIYAKNANVLLQDYLISKHYFDYSIFDKTYQKGLNQLKDKHPEQYKALPILGGKVMEAAKTASSNLDDKEKEGSKFAVRMFIECASGQIPIFKLSAKD